jgi:hypothetical protein
MAPSLAAAKAAVERGDWHFVLGLARGATVAQIQKARRQLQKGAHEDKGGSSELSTLINVAADNLLHSQTQKASWDTQEDYDTLMRKMNEEHKQRRWEEDLRKDQEDQRRREGDLRKRQQDEQQRWEEDLRKRKADGLENAIRLSSRRGAGFRSRLLLSTHTGNAFPAVQTRLWGLYQMRAKTGAKTAYRSLIYAAESEIIARRCVRETQFPKTVCMSERDPLKAKRLVVLKSQYDKAYQRLRYLTKHGQPSLHILLSTRRLLGEAWATLLAIPAPLPSGETIELGDI